MILTNFAESHFSSGKTSKYGKIGKPVHSEDTIYYQLLLYFHVELKFSSCCFYEFELLVACAIYFTGASCQQKRDVEITNKDFCW